MAKISTTIALNDNVTPVLRRINRAIDMSIGQFHKLDRATKGLDNAKVGNGITSGLSSAGRSVAKFKLECYDSAVSLDQFKSGAEKSARAAQELGEKASMAGSKMKNMNTGNVSKIGSAAGESSGKFASLAGSVGGFVKKLALAYLGTKALSGLVEVTDQMVDAQNRLQVITGSASNAQKAQQAIMESANRSYSNYLDTANQVSKLMMNAPNQFKNVGAATSFVETFNKLGKLGGASVYESSQAMYQLTQSMAKGKLDGDELRSVMEGMPLVAKAIANHFGTDIGTMKQMAAEGKVTASEVKAAMEEAGASTNDIFNKAYQGALTFDMLREQIKNNFLNSLAPVQAALKNLWNSKGVEVLVKGVTMGMNLLMNFAAYVINITAKIGNAFVKTANFIKEHWGMIAPILYTVIGALLIYGAAVGIITAVEWGYATVLGIIAAAQFIYNTAVTIATMAQMGFNAALYACPVVWIVAAIIAIIVAIVAVIVMIGKAVDSSQSALGIICGALNVAVAFIFNCFRAILSLALVVVNNIARQWVTFANFFGNIFRDPVSTIIRTFQSMAEQILSILGGIASAIDSVFGSNLSSTIGSWKKNVSSAGDKLTKKLGNGKYQGKQWEDIDVDKILGGRKKYTTSYKAGVKAGNKMSAKVGNIVAKVRNMASGLNGKHVNANKIPNTMAGGKNASQAANNANNLGKTAGNTGKTAHNTGKVANKLDTTNQELAYLHDIAHRDVVNKYTTASVNVQMTNNNNINNTNDLDDIIDGLVIKVKNAHGLIAEGA